MSVSMVLGRHTNQDPRDLVYSKTQFLVHTFQAEFQATRCPELLQLDLRSPGASAEYQARGLNKQCENYIRQISRVAAELLQQA
jgi:hypothetical protein